MFHAAASALAVIAVTASSPAALADGRTKLCVDAYDAEQRRAEAGDLLGAREQLYICGATSCPAVVVKQCVEGLQDVEARLPTIALAVQDFSGHDLTDVKVTLDGFAFRDHVDGRELALNPGAHVLRVTSASGTASTEIRFVAREREKGRIVRATLPVPEAHVGDARAADGASAPRVETAPATNGAPSRVPVLTYVFGGAGGVALGAFAYFGVTGLSARSDLDACAPLCPESQRDGARAKLRDADIALGLAVVSLGVAATLYVLRPDATSSARRPAVLLVW